MLREMKSLKNDYSEMVKNAYKSKSMQNRLMFIFSSEDLLQAYKRLNYLKQYSTFRKKQVEKIKEKTLILLSPSFFSIDAGAGRQPAVVHRHSTADGADFGSAVRGAKGR